MSLFWSLYDHPFRKNLICARGVTCNSCAEGSVGGGVILKDMISRPSNYAKRNGCLKIWLDTFWELMEVRRGGLFPSNHFWLFKKVLSISNRMSLFWSFYNNNWQSQNYIWYILGKCEVCVGGGGIHPSITLNIKTSDYQSNEPLRSLYDHPFCKNIIWPQGITYNPCPDGWGDVTIKDTISGPFNYAEQNGYLKTLIGCVWGNCGLVMGVSSPPITFDEC